MLARAASGTIVGIEAQEVVVEAQKGKGLPTLVLVGLARGAVRESLVRVRAALASCDVTLSTLHLVVNLLPAELAKDASALDLGLAVSLLAATEKVPASALAGRRFFGEVSLAGHIESVRGAVIIADLARRAGDRELIVAAANAGEAAIIPGIRVLAVETLAELIAYLRGEGVLRVATPNQEEQGAAPPCLSDVCGQAHAKRALEIAAAGGHNLLLVGPPGSGKTMLARRLPGLLPELTPDESIEVTRIHSAAGLLAGRGLVRQRPFRAPHHTASEAALCGGGSVPRPGEITLAHRGVLFLDELPEFSRRALESLREPLEEGAIHVARAAQSLCFPARVLLIAAMNPCPCGRLPVVESGAPDVATPKEPLRAPCLCSFEQIQRYRSRISGPLLDRIDLHVAADAVPYRDYARSTAAEPSARVRERVAAARAQQETRFGRGRCNATMSDAELRTCVPLDSAALAIVEAAIDEHGLSTRAVGRILKVARTIADLDGRATVTAANVAEAARFRLLERFGAAHFAAASEAA